MAIELTGTYKSFVGTGVLSDYTPLFYANTADQVHVYVDDVLQTLGDDYTVTRLGDEEGVNIQANFTVGANVYIERLTPITQEVDTQNNETILEDVLDGEFDKLTMIAQEIAEKANRAILFPKGETGYTLLSAANRANRFISFDALGVPYLSLGTGTDAGLRADLALMTGASLIGIAASGASAKLRSVLDKLRDAIHVKDSNAKLDGVNDDTAALQAFINDHPGQEICWGYGYTILISGSLVPTSGSKWYGTSKLKAKAGASLANPTITEAMIDANGATNFVCEGLEIDANKANFGARYGVRIQGGSRNLASRLYIHDTIQAGGFLGEIANSFFDDCTFENCGANIGTDNHALMIVATAATTDACGARRCRVIGAYRKGIASYALAPGAWKHLLVVDNIVSGCGIPLSSGGGIYLGAPVDVQDSAIVSGNLCFGNYVNYEFDTIGNIAGGPNVSRSSVAQGIVMTGCKDGSMGPLVVTDSGNEGIKLNSCTSLNLDVYIRRSNRTGAGFAPAIGFNDTTHCRVTGSVRDETPLQTFVASETGTSDYNDIDLADYDTGTAGLYQILGTHTRYRTRQGRFSGFQVMTPLDVLHVGGTITQTEALVVVNGDIANLAIPDGVGVVILSNAPANFLLHGIAGGWAGRKLTIINFNVFTCTQKHNSGTATAGNRFANEGNADIVRGANAIFEPRYSALASTLWFAK